MNNLKFLSLIGYAPTVLKPEVNNVVSFNVLPPFAHIPTCTYTVIQRLYLNVVQAPSYPAIYPQFLTLCRCFFTQLLSNCPAGNAVVLPLRGKAKLGTPVLIPPTGVKKGDKVEKVEQRSLPLSTSRTPVGGKNLSTSYQLSFHFVEQRSWECWYRRAVPVPTFPASLFHEVERELVRSGKTKTRGTEHKVERQQLGKGYVQQGQGVRTTGLYRVRKKVGKRSLLSLSFHFLPVPALHEVDKLLPPTGVREKLVQEQLLSYPYGVKQSWEHRFPRRGTRWKCFTPVGGKALHFHLSQLRWERWTVDKLGQKCSVPPTGVKRSCSTKWKDKESWQPKYRYSPLKKAFTRSLRKRISYSTLMLQFNNFIFLIKKTVKKQRALIFLIKKLNLLMLTFFKYIGFLSVDFWKGANICSVLTYTGKRSSPELKSSHRRYGSIKSTKKITFEFSRYLKVYLYKMLWKWVQKRDNNLSQITLISKYCIFIQNNAKFYALK